MKTIVKAQVRIMADELVKNNLTNRVEAAKHLRNLYPSMGLTRFMSAYNLAFKS